MNFKRSREEVEDELLKLHAAGEIDLEAAFPRPPRDIDDALVSQARRAVRDARYRIQGFEGTGRERICPECDQRFWGPWIAYVTCSDECQEANNRQRMEIMRRVRARYDAEQGETSL